MRSKSKHFPTQKEKMRSQSKHFFKGKAQNFWWLSCGDPPVLIPNTEVKPTYTDSTVLETAWEDRQLPESKEKSDMIVALFRYYDAAFLLKKNYQLHGKCEVNRSIFLKTPLRRVAEQAEAFSEKAPTASGG